MDVCCTSHSCSFVCLFVGSLVVRDVYFAAYFFSFLFVFLLNFIDIYRYILVWNGLRSPCLVFVFVILIMKSYRWGTVDGLMTSEQEEAL